MSKVPQAAIIRAPAEGTGPAVVAENLKAGGITGVRILGDTKIPLSTGILLAGSNVEVTDCEVTGAATGIEIRGAAHPVIRASTVQDSVQSGIVIAGAATPWISHNTIVRNGRKTRKPAIRIDDPARPVLVGNTFVDNGGEPVAAPAGMDRAPIQQFNFFLKAPLSPGHVRGGVGP